MKRVLFALVACLVLSSPLLSQEVTLDSVDWTIDPLCPGTGLDDTVEVTLAYSGMDEDDVLYVERGHQTTATSCPHVVQDWAVEGFDNPDGTVTFTVQETTEIHKAFLWRAIWTTDEGSLRVEEFLIEPPGGGDNCFLPPDAPDCPAPSVEILDEPQYTLLGAAWDLSGDDLSVLVVDSTGHFADRVDDPILGTDTYFVAWPGLCPCSLVVLVGHGADSGNFLVGNATPLVFWTQVP